MNTDALDGLIERVSAQVDAALGPLTPVSPLPPGLRRSGPPPTTPGALASLIEHTLLKAEATGADVERFCAEAKAHGFAGVCVNTAHIARVARALAGTPLVPVAVVGFPLGAALSAVKAFEAREAVRLGARELDMVLDVGALKAGHLGQVYRDIVAVVEAGRPAVVKVIIETALLTREEKVAACLVSRAAGAGYVKTSTGFSSAGATAEDVALMRRVVGEGMGVKASGGIRSAKEAMAMVAAGADRLGASASVGIVSSGRTA